jgi:hypothetical protein
MVSWIASVRFGPEGRPGAFRDRYEERKTPIRALASVAPAASRPDRDDPVGK